ncbi:hypothetical protein DEF23_17090 [Marinitenerispora sediminis]|uniref:DUF308 domain-containing protein n=1 Tax=Marinitenerispora sediminis TaxID=1931232 RepID=A0A368T4I3_9ACTN|nr:hypothetical protein DEF28_18410 [Marinitenerispora sediminis]RCV53773.1 hypothetical protein DEF23_17090 [Marinitenerispora sediminis]RCV58061.1 hypothetical protein DEF24_14260 [Marinitenerispora sediminis]
MGPQVAERLLVWGGFPLLGAGAGWLLAWLAPWAASLRWVPFQGPLELVASIPHPQAAIGGIALGVGAGLVVAFLAEQDTLVVTVDDEQVTLVHGESVRTARRDDVAAAFLEGPHLVLLGRSAAELARVAGDRDARRLARAFEAHGYPWRADGDPHREEYRRWIPEDPDLAAGAHALFRARAAALRKKDRADAEQLRGEFGRLGLVVRDESGRQFWRRTT